eukprot:EG_transcript_354
MRRDYGRPTPTKVGKVGTHHQRSSPGANQRSRWKQVFPIAQYQIPNQAYASAGEGDGAPPESLFDRLQGSAAGTASGAAGVSVAEASSSSSATTSDGQLIRPSSEGHAAMKDVPLITAPAAPEAEEEDAIIPAAVGARADSPATLAVSVLHAMEPVPFTELQPLTNLNKPPPNWLTDDTRVLHTYNPGAPRAEGAEFLSSALASTLALKDGWDYSDSDSAESQDSDPYVQSPLPKKVDIIAPAENLKKLFLAAYNDSPVALTIHRVGGSLVLEGDLPATCRKSTKKVHTRSMMSKFLYYSILAEQLDESLAAAKKKSHAIPLPAKGQEEAFKHAQPWMGPGSPAANALKSCGRVFSRTLHWKFQDLNLLLGSNALIMQMRDKTEVSIRMREEPLSQADALDYWLDNVMTNVPNVAVCFHKEGIIQGYQVVSTSEIPSFNDTTRFDPKVVEEHCGSILHWLTDHCTTDAGSYLLVREKESNLFKLYDLADFQRQAEADEPSERPFGYSVGMMCFRMGDRLLQSRSDQDRAEARDLLLKSVEMVSEDQEPALIALAHEKIAQTYLPVAEDEPSREEDQQEAEAEDAGDKASAKTKKRRKKRRRSRAGKQEGAEEGTPDKAKAGTLVTVESRRDHSKRALEHLQKGMLIMAKHLENGAHDAAAIRRMTEGKIQCYLELARVEAVSLNLSDAFRWMDLAIEHLPSCDPARAGASSPHPSGRASPPAESGRASPSVHQPYGQEAPVAAAKRDSDAASVTPSSAVDDEQAQLHFKTFTRRTKVSLHHILGDMHYAIASQLEVDGGERSQLWVQEHEKIIQQLLTHRRAVQTASHHTSPLYIRAAELFEPYLPLSLDVRECFGCCIKLYDQALTLTDSNKDKVELCRKKAAARTEIAKAVMVAGDLPKAQELFGLCFQTWRALGDVANQVLTLNNMGRVDHALAAEEQKTNSKEVHTPEVDKPKEDHLNNGLSRTGHTEDDAADFPRSHSPEFSAGAAGDGAEVEDPMKSLSSAAQGPVLGTLNNCTLAGNMSVHEENLRYSAIKCFNDAAALLDLPETQHTVSNWVALKKVTDGNLAFAYFELAARLKQNFTALFSSKKDVEKAIAELFLRSITLYELAGQHEKMAFAQCYVASLYFSAWQHRYVPVGSGTALTQLNDKRFKLADMYYRKALQYYMGALQEVQHPHQLNNMMPRVSCALAELYRFAYITGGSRTNLEKALTMLQNCKPWFVVAYKLMDDPSVRSSPWGTALFPISRPAASPTEAKPASPEAQQLRSVIGEQAAQVSKHVKEDLMLFLKANRPTANEYQQAKVAYSLALKSSDILQILDSVQRIKGKAMLAGIKGKAISNV